MASPAWRMPAMDRSSLSSMSFRPAASSSNSSRAPRTGARARRSPLCTAATTAFSPAMARLTLRLTISPPARPSSTIRAPAPRTARTIFTTKDWAWPMSAPTNRVSPVGKAICSPLAGWRISAPFGSVSVSLNCFQPLSPGENGEAAIEPVIRMPFLSVSR